jgi:hypothetical protein
MTNHRPSFRPSYLAAAAAVIVVAVGATNAANAAEINTPPAQVNLAAVNRQADSDAQRYVQIALSELSKGDAHVARDRLERAETALLNREAFDLGAGLKADQPLPKTPLMAEIDSARAALASHDIAKATQISTATTRDIGADAGNLS